MTNATAAALGIGAPILGVLLVIVFGRLFRYLDRS